MAKTVREVIPESRLARCYGEFQYDVARERLYAQDEFTLPMQSSENEQRLATEPWMRADVEREFERLMRPPEVVLTCAYDKKNSTTPSPINKKLTLSSPLFPPEVHNFAKSIAFNL